MADRLCECGCGRQVARRFVKGHNHHKSPVAFILDPETGCWNWQRAKNKLGYGQRRVGTKTVPAYRYFYEKVVGPIPEGLTLDHLCRNHACINPSHLEPVSMAENLRRGESFSGKNARKTHCIHGHPFDEANTYITKRGRRACRACHERARQEFRERQASAA